MNVNEERPMILGHYAACFLQNSEEPGLSEGRTGIRIEREVDRR